jgi:hypothetical protein
VGRVQACARTNHHLLEQNSISKSGKNGTQRPHKNNHAAVTGASKPAVFFGAWGALAKKPVVVAYLYYLCMDELGSPKMSEFEPAVTVAETPAEQTVARRAKWERPTVSRLGAEQAEGNTGNGNDTIAQFS